MNVFKILILTWAFFAGTALAGPEMVMLGKINAMRTSGMRCPGGGGGYKLKPLALNATLSAVAKMHAFHMATGHFLSHSYRGKNARTRLANAGYRFSRMSEIIHKGSYADPNRPMRWWQQSNIHCRAIMNSFYTQIGIGYSPLGNSWAVEMALPL